MIPSRMPSTPPAAHATCASDSLRGVGWTTVPVPLDGMPPHLDAIPPASRRRSRRKRRRAVTACAHRLRSGVTNSAAVMGWHLCPAANFVRLCLCHRRGDAFTPAFSEAVRLLKNGYHPAWASCVELFPTGVEPYRQIESVEAMAISCPTVIFQGIGELTIPEAPAHTTRRGGW